MVKSTAELFCCAIVRAFLLVNSNRFVFFFSVFASIFIMVNLAKSMVMVFAINVYYDRLIRLESTARLHGDHISQKRLVHNLTDFVFVNIVNVVMIHGTAAVVRHFIRNGCTRTRAPYRHTNYPSPPSNAFGHFFRFRTNWNPYKI